MPLRPQPPPGGYDDALTRSRRRQHRRRVVTGIGSAGATFGLVAVALLWGQGAMITLKQDDQPAAPPANTTATPAVTSNPGQPTPTATGQAAPRDGSAPAEASSPAGHEPSVPAPDSATSPTEVGTTPISTALVRGGRDYRSTTPCADSSGRPASGWCIQFAGPFAGRAGTVTTFDLTLCRLPGFPTANASFPSSSEAAFSLKTTEREPRDIWSYASQHPGRPNRHSLTVQSGRCLTWELRWSNRDDSGRPVPAGTYTLAVDVTADNLITPNQVSTQVYDYRVR